MPKAIKSFTVDENVYNGLVALFKKYNAEVSISLLLNNCLKEMLEYLTVVKDGLEDLTYKVPMNYIISKMVKERILNIPNKYFIKGEGDTTKWIENHLDGWEESYEAYQKGIPEELYPYIRNYGYGLSADKKYLIEPKTGKRYAVIDGKRFQVIETDEEEAEKRKKRGKHGK